jgi:hypothetical protein
MVHRNDLTGSVSGQNHRLGLCLGHRKWLFHQHMQPRIQCLQRMGAMQMRRGQDVHGINAACGQHRLDRRIGAGPPSRSQTFSRSQSRIGHRHQTRACGCQSLGMPFRDIARADKPHTDDHD